MTVPNADIAAKRDGHQPTAQSSQRLAPFPHQNERRPNRRIGIVNGRPIRDQGTHGTSQSFDPANIRVPPWLRESSVVSLTAALESTGQCDSSSVRAPARLRIKGDAGYQAVWG